MNRKKNSAWPWLAGAGIGLTLGMRIFRRLWGREDFDGQVVLISGGSRGLGLLLAREFGRQGARLALFARDLGELEAAAALEHGVGAALADGSLTIGPDGCPVGGTRAATAAILERIS